MCRLRGNRWAKWLLLASATAVCVGSVTCVDSRVVTTLFTQSVADFVTGSAAIFIEDFLGLRIPM